MVEYRGALTEDDYVEVVRLRRRVLREGGTTEDPLLWFAIGFAALAAVGYFGGPVRDPASLWWLAFAGPCLALWWFRRAQPRRQWRTIPALRAEHWGAVTDDSLQARLFNQDANIPWGFFSAQEQSKRALVLFVGAHLQVMLARSFFRTDDAWREACGTIATKVSTPERGVRKNFRTVLVWLVILLGIFLAWHFAQFQRG